jgi:hypothetical protein
MQGRREANSLIRLMNLYYNFHFNPLPANVENMVIPNNASKGQMGFNSAFKGLVFV